MKIGITFSSFDLFHPGHIVLLEQAKLYCDYLIVGLHVNPTKERDAKNLPIQNLVERYLQVAACKYVDEIIPYETEEELELILLTKLPNIRFIGMDYCGKDFTGKELCKSYGIDIKYLTRDHGFSSTELRKRIKDNT